MVTNTWHTSFLAPDRAVGAMTAPGTREPTLYTTDSDFTLRGRRGKKENLILQKAKTPIGAALPLLKPTESYLAPTALLQPERGGGGS